MKGKNPTIFPVYEVGLALDTEDKVTTMKTYPSYSVSFLVNSVIIDHCTNSDVQINTQRIHVHKAKESHYGQNITLWKGEYSARDAISLTIRRSLRWNTLISINLLFILPLAGRTFTELAANKKS